MTLIYLVSFIQLASDAYSRTNTKNNQRLHYINTMKQLMIKHAKDLNVLLIQMVVQNEENTHNTNLVSNWSFKIKKNVNRIKTIFFLNAVPNKN